MDVVLISGRSLLSEAHPSRERARGLVAALRSRGDTVRWLCPVVHGELVEFENCLQVSSRAPGFRSVQGRISDLESELRLSHELRESPPDLVHQLSCGGGTSEALSWIAQRLGVPCVVSLELAETLCHRGTLVDERGRACADWDDPLRCRSCCSTGSLMARLLRPLGGLSPFPSKADFENRADMLVAGLMAADSVWVRDAAARDALIRAGVPGRAVVVEGDGDADATLRRYDEMI